MAHGAGFQQRFALRQGCLARGRVFARQGERAQRKRAEERRPGLSADLYRLFRVGHRFRPPPGYAMKLRPKHQRFGLEASRP